jgi:hypothetical protein
VQEVTPAIARWNKAAGVRRAERDPFGSSARPSPGMDAIERIMTAAMRDLHGHRLRLASVLLAVMLSLDASIIAADLATAFGKYIGLAYDRDPRLSVTLDFGYGECFNYLKETVIVAAVLMLFARTGQVIYLVLSLLFLFLLLDDSLQFHERSGYWIAAAVPLKAAGGLEPNDVGELIYWSGLGSAVAVALLVGFICSSRTTWRVAAAFLGLVALLSFFGIAMDAMHSKFGVLNRELMYVLGVSEDGGEMMILSIICAFSIDIACRDLPQESSKRSSDAAGREGPPALGTIQDNR